MGFMGLSGLLLIACGGILVVTVIAAAVYLALRDQDR